MTHRIHEYRGQSIVVRYDAQRCIHAAECVTRLSAVFDTSQRRWVEPDNLDHFNLDFTIQKQGAGPGKPGG